MPAFGTLICPLPTRHPCYPLSPFVASISSKFALLTVTDAPASASDDVLKLRRQAGRLLIEGVEPFNRLQMVQFQHKLL